MVAWQADSAAAGLMLREDRGPSQVGPRTRRHRAARRRRRGPPKRAAWAPSRC